MSTKPRHSESFADRLKKTMYLRDFSVAQLARSTRIGESTIHRYLSGEREPIYGNLIEIASALKADLNFLAGMDPMDSGEMAAAFISKLASEVGVRLGAPRVNEGSSDLDPARILGRLPVMGRISEGPSIDFTEQGYPGARSLFFIPTLGDAGRHAYGLVVDDDSMTPRILDGDIVVCCPDEDWEFGDLVVIRKSSGEMVLRLVQDRNSSYVLRSYDPARDLEELSKRQVSFIHKLTSIRPRAHSNHSETGYEF